MYFTTQEKKECCGCKACADSCPAQAMRYVSDAQGFWYPQIETQLCIHCKQCETVCTFNRIEESTDYSVYAAWSKEPALRDNSSSGGIFSLLAEQVLAAGGTVIGAAFGEDFRVVHSLATTKEEAAAFRRSKYVQSDTAGIYSAAKALLEKGTAVLFSGTPCQIAGLKAYLKKEYEALICCEVLCYGVPSPQVYKAYLKHLEEKYHAKIKSINFKDKRYGWDYYTTAITFENGKSHCEFGGDSYKTFMGKNWSIRPSCLECRYSVNFSRADISLGDFYGVQKYITEKEPKNGVSCVICRSEKARQLLEAVKEKLILSEVDSERFARSENKQPKKHDKAKRQAFFDAFSTGGYAACEQLLEKKPLSERARSKLLAAHLARKK
ncbi:MAG: Coenzyme F420 hydrogenase/dehydrogenase, beta subunit C-terminal domain [Clostridia bacterium]|nr:Coenzyme F420 hydrogenase/dehydrogenase, beta subunit C-terminal domain [Clostridia bacterium]